LTKWRWDEFEQIDVLSLLEMIKEMIEVSSDIFAQLDEETKVYGEEPGSRATPSSREKNLYWYQDGIGVSGITLPTVPGGLSQVGSAAVDAGASPGVLPTAVLHQHWISREILNDLPVFSGGTAEYLVWKNRVHPLLKLDQRGMMATFNTLCEHLKGEAKSKIERVTAWGRKPS
jgi:hypothetical protein